MKSNQSVIPVLALLLLGGWMLVRQTHQTAETVQGPSSADESLLGSPGSSASAPHSAWWRDPSAPRAKTADPGRPTAPAQPQVRILEDEVLATVDGVALRLGDLMPINPGSTGAEFVLEPTRYEALLNRAVEREVAFRAAKAAGIGLTESQSQNLARRRAESSTLAPGQFDDLGRTAANTEFEQRDMEGLMLLHNLAAIAGVPPSHVTPEQVQQYFTEHRNELPMIPQNPAQVQAVADTIDADIRARLSPAVSASYREQFHQFVEQLKSKAQIAVARSISRESR